jgi:hypothetical protein
MHHEPQQGRLKIIVLTAGDELASHHGASGLTPQRVEVRAAEDEGEIAAIGSVVLH